MIDVIYGLGETPKCSIPKISLTGGTRSEGSRDETSVERATRRRLERRRHDLGAKVVESQKRVDDAYALVRVGGKHAMKM